MRLAGGSDPAAYPANRGASAALCSGRTNGDAPVRTPRSPGRAPIGCSFRNCSGISSLWSSLHERASFVVSKGRRVFSLLCQSPLGRKTKFGGRQVGRAPLLCLRKPVCTFESLGRVWSATPHLQRRNLTVWIENNSISKSLFSK